MKFVEHTTRAALVALILVASSARAVEEVTLDAAFHCSGYTYLIANSRYYLINPSGDEMQSQPLTALHIPSDRPSPIQAVLGLCSPSNGATFIAYEQDGGFRYKGTTHLVTDLKESNTPEEFRNNGGPDAAGTKGSETYIFKGCEVSSGTGANAWGGTQNLENLGLPCDVDAAWTKEDSPDTMVVLKGDQVWLWSSYQVTGPNNFHDLYNVVSFKLKSASR